MLTLPPRCDGPRIRLPATGAPDTIVLGIDEAGRGPVIGPLVLCGVRADQAGVEGLTALSPRDSKTYGAGDGARRRRADLSGRICALADVRLEIIDVEEIDRWVEKGGLNRLERACASRIIDAGAAPTRIIADGARLFLPLRQRYAALEARDRADAEEVTVAAASIVAKVARDQALSELLSPYQAEFGPIKGGGYPNFATERFLRAFVGRHGRLPEGVRRSWGWRPLQELTARVTAAQIGLGEAAAEQRLDNRPRIADDQSASF